MVVKVHSTYSLFAALISTVAVATLAAWSPDVDAQPLGNAQRSRTFDVQDYGAIADGRTQDEMPIAKATSAAEAWTAQNPSNTAIVYFPRGVYALSHLYGLFAINVNNTRNISFNGEDCRTSDGDYCVKLIGSPVSLSESGNVASNSFFSITKSHDIGVKNFSLDKAHPYFSQGRVTSLDPGGNSVELQTDPGYPDLDEPWVARTLNVIFFFTEPGTGTWDHEPVACGHQAGVVAQDRGCHLYHIVGRTRLGPSHWRLALDHEPPPNAMGKPYLLWKNLGWQAGFLITQSVNVRLENIFYTGGGGSGVHIQRDDGETLIRNFVIDVPPGSGRLFAANSGFNGTTRGRVEIDHVRVVHTDDDATHFSAGPYYPAIQQADGNTVLRLALCYEDGIRPGDRLSIWDWRNKQEINAAKALSVTIVHDADARRFPRTCDVRLDHPLPALQNLRVYDPAKVGREQDDNPRVVDDSIEATLRLTNSYLSAMRARCGIIQMSAVVANNSCENTPLAGFLVGPEYSWGEGYSVNGVTFDRNRFDHVGGTAIYIANIIDSNRMQTLTSISGGAESGRQNGKPNTNILIENNSFNDLGAFRLGTMGVPGVAISIQDANNVRLLGNSFGPQSTGVEADLPSVTVSKSTTASIQMR